MYVFNELYRSKKGSCLWKLHFFRHRWKLNRSIFRNWIRGVVGRFCRHYRNRIWAHFAHKILVHLYMYTDKKRKYRLKKKKKIPMISPFSTFAIQIFSSIRLIIETMEGQGWVFQSIGDNIQNRPVTINCFEMYKNIYLRNRCNKSKDLKSFLN